MQVTLKEPGPEYKSTSNQYMNSGM